MGADSADQKNVNSTPSAFVRAHLLSLYDRGCTERDRWTDSKGSFPHAGRITGRRLRRDRMEHNGALFVPFSFPAP